MGLLELSDGADDEATDVVSWQVNRAIARRPFVDLRDLGIALRRRSRWWLALAAAGVFVGMAISVAFPPRATATSTILVGHPSGVDPSRSILTDAQLLTAKEVARAAVEKLGLHESASSFLERYSGTVVSDDLLEVTSSAASDAEATRQTNVIAKQYLAFRKQVYRHQLDDTISALQERKSTLESELASLTASIGGQAATSGAAGGGDGNPQVDQLVAKSADVAAELAAVRGAILNATEDSTKRIEGSGIVDPASVDSSSRLKALVRNAATGGAAGLVIGMGLVVLLAVFSTRAWRREDVAAALQAPVSLSVRSLKIRRSVPVRRFRRELVNPTGDLAQLVADARRSIALGTNLERSLAVVSIDSPHAAALVVGSVALELAHEGARIALVDFSERSILAGLFGVESGMDLAVDFGASPGAIRILRPPSTSSLGDERDEGGLGVEAWLPGDPHLPARDVVLVLAELDPAVGARGLRYWASGAIAVVTAGRSPLSTLVSTAEMLRSSPVELRSAVLVGADRHDDTLGLVSPDRAPGEPGSVDHMPTETAAHRS